MSNGICLAAKQQTTVKMEKGVQKTTMSRDRARKIDERINDRSRRLKDRLKQNAVNVVDTNDPKKLKKMTKKAMLVTTPIVGKEKMGFNLECGDNDNTHPHWRMMNW